MSNFDAVLQLLLMMLEQPRMVLLMTLLPMAAVIDWRTLRIPNWLTFGGATLALLLSVVAPQSPHMGLSFTLGGLGLGLALMLPLYLLRVMGAGDVKLMAMVGAYLGAYQVAWAVLFVFITGGVFALAMVALRRAWQPLLHNFKGLFLMLRVAPGAVVRSGGVLASMPSVGKLPYAASICIGTFIYLFSHQLGYV